MGVAGWVLRGGAVVVPIAVGWMFLSDLRALRELNVSIGVENGLVDSLKTENRKLTARVREVGEEVKALPESARMGRAIRGAQEIAKHQNLVDGLITRSRARIQNLETAKQERRRRNTVRTVSGIGGWVLILFAYSALRRRVARGIAGSV